MATVNPDGDLPGVATSTFLRPTRDLALRSPGIKFDVGDVLDSASPMTGTSSKSDGLAEQETRKMNMYQAIRDAMR